jgi:predicted permease
MLRLPFFKRPRRPSDAEIARELSDHLSLHAEEMVAAGESQREASFHARRQFGNVGIALERTREVWAIVWLERLQQDFKYGVRTLRRSTVFSLVAVICLALGIGAHAAISSWTEGIMRRPFPLVRDQDQLVAVAGTAKGASGLDEMSWPDFMDISRAAPAFSSFFVAKITGATLTGGDRAERLVGQLVTANYFDAIGVRPVLGRGFLPGEDVGRGAHPVTVISYRLWQDRFAGNPRVIGSTIAYNRIPHTIVGVTPDGFLGTFVGYAMQFWTPASQQAVFDASGYKLEDRTARWVEGFARLEPGVSVAAGQAQIDGAARRLALEFPNEDRGRGVRIFPLSDNPFDNAKALKPMLGVGGLIAILVLVIVCANIANLLLVRAVARRSELSVRRALGASRARVTRQLVTEGLILAVLGTATGLALAYVSRNALGLFFAPRGGVSLVFAADFNWRVIGTTIAIGLGSTLLFALAPAIHTTRLDLASAIRAAAPGAVAGSRGLLRAGLVIVQVTVSVLLLTGAGLVVTSLGRLLIADPGFSTTNVTTTAVSLFAAGYDSARAHRFQDELLLRMHAIGGVSAAALARSLPFSTAPYDNGPIMVDGYQPAKDEQPTADYNKVSPDYFRTLGIPLLAGRDFTIADVDTSAPVAIVSRTLAQRYWPNESPLGRRLRLRETWMRVVGVVGDMKYRSLTEAPGMLFYVPLAQQRSTGVFLFLRTSSSRAATGIGPALTGVIHGIDPNVSPYEILTMREQVNRWTSTQRILVTLLGIFSGVALFLAVLGLYGTLSYMVSQNTRELGLRMALGARPSQLLGLVMSSGLRLALIGVVLGVVIALGTTRLLGDLLYRVSPRDPMILAAVSGTMAVAAAVACFVPAWRAARLDPARALRL